MKKIPGFREHFQLDFDNWSNGKKVQVEKSWNKIEFHEYQITFAKDANAMSLPELWKMLLKHEKLKKLLENWPFGTYYGFKAGTFKLFSCRLMEIPFFTREHEVRAGSINYFDVLLLVGFSFFLKIDTKRRIASLWLIPTTSLNIWKVLFVLSTMCRQR